MKIGDVLSNKYCLKEELSSTSSNTVFLIGDINTKNDGQCYVAKVFSAKRQDYYGIYENEVRILKNIHHPNMVKFIDEGKCPTHDVFYIITDYIDGKPFDQWCRNKGVDALCCAVACIEKILSPLALIHNNDYVHKDIKPSNILVESDDTPYLLDFGISETMETLTTQSCNFSLAYISPEESKREKITPSTDIYKLGIMLIESVLSEEDANSFRQLNLTLIDAIENVCSGPWSETDIKNILMTMTAQNSQDRYASCDDLGKELKQWLGHAEEYALVWTNGAKDAAMKEYGCESYEINIHVQNILSQSTLFAEWKDDEKRGASITISGNDLFLRIKPDGSKRYFTVVEYRTVGYEPLKQRGSVLEQCKFNLYMCNRDIERHNDCNDLINKLQQIELDQLRENDQRNAKKGFLEQANSYQKAQREVFERKRFPPFQVTIKACNRGEKELVCCVREEYCITEGYFKELESAKSIQNKLSSWGVKKIGSNIEEELNHFIQKPNVFSAWLISLKNKLREVSFPEINKLDLYKSAEQEEREKKAYEIIMFLFKHELIKPQEDFTLSKKEAGIGFFERKPPHQQGQSDSPLLYGIVNRRESRKQELTIEYNNTSSHHKLKKGDMGWIGHFSIREESQLHKQEKALKDLEYGKGVEERLLETLARVERLAPRHEELMLDHYLDPQLDEDQQKAVAKCVLLDAGQFAVLQGPPGTGKTTVITEVVNQIFEHYPKAKVLVASQSHQAVDNVLEKICRDKRVVRLGEDERLTGAAANFSYQTIATTMLDNIKAKVQQEACYLNETELDNISSNDLKKLEALRQEWVSSLSGRDEDLENVLFKSVQVVFGTLVGMAANKYENVNQKFDYVIIDEAGKAILSELAIPINRGHRFVLVGDHKQLPPILEEESLAMLDTQTRESIKTTFFEDLYTSLEKTRPGYCHTLIYNYRMHSDICTPVSQLFYDNQLKTPPSVERAHGLKFNHSLYWLNTSKLTDHYEKSNGQGKYYNPCHIQRIKELLQKINAACISAQVEKTIAVISPYRESISKLQRAIHPKDDEWSHISIEIETVDKFQGSDRDIVVFDSVRSNQKKQLGFITDAARLNVALSRAKEMLFIVGDAEALYNGTCPKGGSNPYSKLIELLHQSTDQYGWIDLDNNSGVSNVQ